MLSRILLVAAALSVFAWAGHASADDGGEDASLEAGTDGAMDPPDGGTDSATAVSIDASEQAPADADAQTSCDDGDADSGGVCPPASPPPYGIAETQLGGCSIARLGSADATSGLGACGVVLAFAALSARRRRAERGSRG